MEFKEIKKAPEFTLTMSLEEAIDLWKIVSTAKQNGNNNAFKFVSVLHDFASNSNNYTKYL